MIDLSFRKLQYKIDMKVVYIQHNRFRVSWIRQRKLKKIDV